MPAPRRAFTLIEVLVVLTIIAILVAISVPMLLGAKRSANETSAIASLRLLVTQQQQFAVQDADGDIRPDYGSLADLQAAGLIDEVLDEGRKAGYRIEVGASTSHPTARWLAVANPLVAGATGDRSFAVNHRGLIHYSEEPLLLDLETCAIPADARPIE